MTNYTLTIIIAAFCAAILPLKTKAQAVALKNTIWSSFGVSFKAPSDAVVEDDSEEGYTLGDSTYYITVQLLESEGMKKTELTEELENIATDDEISDISPANMFELPQFYGASLKGKCETDPCVYAYLLAKDGSCGFYISVLYKQENDSTPDMILESFSLE